MADEKDEQLNLPLSDQELFSSATAPAEPSAAPEAPPPVPEPTPPPVVAPQQPQQAAPQGEGAIPSWRLREEAEGRRLAEQRAAMLEGRLNEIAAHLRQNQKPPDFFADPDAATQGLILRTLQPYAEETRKTLMHMGRMVASAVHGIDKVDAAEQAFLDARARETLDPADYERVVQSPNRYDAVVQWHQRHNVLASVGNDPNAWFEKQLEARMADPQFQAKMMEKVRSGAATRPSETRLPPSLSGSTAAVGNSSGPGDASDSSIFAYATAPRKGRATQ